ncbi:MAG: hypothetical protein KA116_06865 [Proteobacteria bacterium]|nr:hypothetical protein [Pseudomonadota bacterium]
MGAKKRQNVRRHLGLELSGPRGDHTFLCALDVFPHSHRCVLTDVLQPKEDFDPDQPLIEAIKNLSSIQGGQCAGIGVNAPLSFPPLFRSLLKGKATSSENKELKWMQETHKELLEKMKIKAFLPYLQRAGEIYLRHFTKERFPIADSFSSSGATLAIRLLYCQKFIKKTSFSEVYARGAVQRICQSLRMPKFVENNYSHLTSGVEARYEFFQNLQSKVPGFFFYDEHLETLTMHIHAFNSFVCALTDVLSFAQATERKPGHFPSETSWILLPKQVITWDRVFK